MDILNALKSVVTSIKNWVNEKLKKKVDVVEGKGLSTNDLTDDLLGKINSFDESIAAAKKAGDDAQVDVDALETKVGNIPDGFKATTVIGYINEKTENTTSDSAMQELADRVTELEKQVSGNLLKAPLTVENETGDGKIIELDYSLGLEVGKTYKVSVTFGKDNTALDTTIKYRNIGGDMYALEWFYPSITDARAYFYLYDKLSMGADEEPVFKENGAMFVAGAEETYAPLTINSITLVEEASNGNLLSEPIVVSEATHTIEDIPMSLINVPTFGLEVDKNYKVTITYNGTQNEFNCIAEDWQAAEGAIILMPVDSDRPYVMFENTSVMLADKVIFDFSSGSPMPSASTDYGIIQATTADGTNPMSLPFSIDSIVEAKVEYATKEEVGELEARVTALEKSGEPQNLLSESVTWTEDKGALGNPFVSDTNLGLEVGKAYTLCGTMGVNNTPWEVTFTATDSSASGLGEGGILLGGAVVSPVICGVYDKFAIVDSVPTPAENGSFIVFTANEAGTEEHIPFTINSITEAQVEYATKKSVDNLSEQVGSIEERVIALEKSDEPQNLLSEPVIFETAGHEEMIEVSPIGIVAGKSYKVSGTYGTPTTAFEYTAVASLMGDDGKVRTIALMTPTEALLNGHLAIMIMCNEELVEGGLVEGATPYMIMIGGMAEGQGYNDEFFANDTYSPLVINSITESPEEYATVSYVDNIIAEINNKLEALYGGTEV